MGRTSSSQSSVHVALCCARLVTTVLVLLALVAIMSIQAWSTPAFEHVVVFGDSLSDTGNAGRSSNGPVWIEYLADRLGLQLSPSQRGGGQLPGGGGRPGCPPRRPRPRAPRGGFFFKLQPAPAESRLFFFGGG